MKKIAIIVTWFGKLPSYFPAWLKSAESNNTIDFLIFCDQDISSDKDNIITYKTTLQDEVLRYEKILNRKISISNAYKFCDCRLFFGLFYEQFIKDYDFWGYCDIDLVFGDIRNFVTDEILSTYDRIYEYGHLCLYRNNYKMNHIYDLNGGIYTLDEIFEGRAKTTPEEHFGVNRICKLNNIRWYRKEDYIDLRVSLTKRLEVSNKKKNTLHQIYIWRHGKAYCFHCENGNLYTDEVVYIHWQKKKPIIEDEKLFNDIYEFVITTDKFIVDLPKHFTEKWMDRVNPPMKEYEKKVARYKYLFKTMKKYLKSDIPTKRIWFRQIRYRLMDYVEGNK